MSTLTLEDLRQAAEARGFIVDRFSGQVAQVIGVHAGDSEYYRVTVAWGGSNGRMVHAVNDLTHGARLLAPLEALALADVLGKNIEDSPEPIYVRNNLGVGNPFNVKG